MNANAPISSTMDSYENLLVEVRPSRARAYDVGKAVMALQFVACQAAFGIADARSQVDRKFDDLHATLREALPVELQHRFRELVAVGRERFWNTVNSEQLGDEFEAKSVELASERISRSDASREYLEPVMRPSSQFGTAFVNSLMLSGERPSILATT